MHVYTSNAHVGEQDTLNMFDVSSEQKQTAIEISKSKLYLRKESSLAQFDVDNVTSIKLRCAQARYGLTRTESKLANAWPSVIHMAACYQV